jgi:hypothetical protein
MQPPRVLYAPFKPVCSILTGGIPAFAGMVPGAWFPICCGNEGFFAVFVFFVSFVFFVVKNCRFYFNHKRTGRFQGKERARRTGEK